MVPFIVLGARITLVGIGLLDHLDCLLPARKDLGSYRVAVKEVDVSYHHGDTYIYMYIYIYTIIYTR